MYKIIWQYEVAEVNRQRFEKEYGKQGVWSELFSTSTDYLGSLLSRDVDTQTRYVLVDNWKSKRAYEHFLEENKETYEKLSDTMAGSYLREERIGGFESKDS